MSTRSVVHTPVTLPAAVQIRASISEVVVLPLVPVIAAVGTRAERPSNRTSRISALMSRPGSANQCGRNPGCPFHLTDHPTDLQPGPTDIRGQIHTRDIQSDDARSPGGERDVVGMGDLRYVLRSAARADVPGFAPADCLPIGRDRIRLQSLLGQKIAHLVVQMHNLEQAVLLRSQGSLLSRFRS